VAVVAAADAALIAQVALYFHPGRRGNLEVWARILRGLNLRGDKTLLDMGCGRGAVLLTAAKLLSRGRAIGVDLWRADHTGNSAQQTLANAAAKNVADRVEVRTADITDLPFDDDSVDVIVSSRRSRRRASRRLPCVRPAEKQTS
jgi:ubiquinone/menaquinone biosynthesis C-methylase UbiE